MTFILALAHFTLHVLRALSVCEFLSVCEVEHGLLYTALNCCDDHNDLEQCGGERVHLILQFTVYH